MSASAPPGAGPAKSQREDGLRGAWPTATAEGGARAWPRAGWPGLSSAAARSVPAMASGAPSASEACGAGRVGTGPRPARELPRGSSATTTPGPPSRGERAHTPGRGVMWVAGPQARTTASSVARRYKLPMTTTSTMGKHCYPALARAIAIWWACGPCLATRSASRHWAAVMPHCTDVRKYSARRPDHA